MILMFDHLFFALKLLLMFDSNTLEQTGKCSFYVFNSPAIFCSVPSSGSSSLRAVLIILNLTRLPPPKSIQGHSRGGLQAGRALPSSALLSLFASLPYTGQNVRLQYLSQKCLDELYSFIVVSLSPHCILGFCVTPAAQFR